MPGTPTKRDRHGADQFRRLRFFRDLFKVLSAGQPLTLEKAAAEMKLLGWTGGAAQISRELNALEQRENGDGESEPLVDRTPGGRAAVVTRAGRHLFERIMELDIAFRKCLRPTPKPPPIVVGLTTTLSTLHFSRVLAQSGWLSEYPDVEVRVQEGNWPQLTHALIQGEVDFAVGPVLPPDQRFASERLYRLKRLLLIPPVHRKLSLLRPSDVTWQDIGDALAGQTLFTLPEGVQPLQDLSPLFDAAPTLRKVELPSYIEILAYVRQGLGAGVCVAGYSQPWERETRLRTLDITQLLGAPIDIYLYVPQKKQAVTVPAKALKEAIKSYRPDPKALYSL